MGSLHTLPDPANDPAAVARPLQVASARFVTIRLAAALTGLTEGAIRTKIARGVWLENRQYVRRDGNVLVDMKGYDAWAEYGQT